jgi:hypothetical protein
MNKIWLKRWKEMLNDIENLGPMGSDLATYLQKSVMQAVDWVVLLSLPS